ncbi:hypothetical protein GOC82_32165 [Sinorhizobium medicae]|nr:hypothetical protein [Sinorhizobium medicae]
MADLCRKAKRLKALEDETPGLKKLLAEQMLDAAALRASSRIVHCSPGDSERFTSRTCRKVMAGMHPGLPIPMKPPLHSKMIAPPESGMISPP